MFVDILISSFLVKGAKEASRKIKLLELLYEENCFCHFLQCTPLPSPPQLLFENLSPNEMSETILHPDQIRLLSK